MHRIDSPSRKRICNPWLCIGIALVTIPSLRAQDAAFIAIVKSQNFEQFGPLTVGLKDEDFFDTYEAPFVFDAFVAPDDFGLVTGATLSAPGGASSPLLLDEDE
jgi:hypothetical protein